MSTQEGQLSYEGDKMKRTISDETAMIAIHELLSGEEWGTDTLEEVRDIVELTGREVKDYNPEEED